MREGGEGMREERRERRGGDEGGKEGGEGMREERRKGGEGREEREGRG